MSDKLFCSICTAEIPEARARRRTQTCSEKCKNKLDAIRERQSADRKCPLCLHPSSQEERASFRQWRVSRGELKSAVAVPRELVFSAKHKLRDALRTDIKLFEHCADWFAELNEAFADGARLERLLLTETPKLREKLKLQMRVAQALVDKGENQTTLSQNPSDPEGKETENVDLSAANGAGHDRSELERAGGA